MAVRIRLRRIGKNPKKKPHFRIGVYEESQGRDARTIDELGFYNPVSGEVKLDKERLAYWKKNGANGTRATRSISPRPGTAKSWTSSRSAGPGNTTGAS